MDKILTYYDRGKFRECIELLKKLPEGDEDLYKKFFKKNNTNVCQSLITILENDHENLEEYQDTFYLFYHNILSLGPPNKVIPLRLELVAEYNLLWWILFWVNAEVVDEAEVEQCMHIINKGLVRSGDYVPRTYVSTTDEFFNIIKIIMKNLHKEDFINITLTLEIIVIVLLYILKMLSNRQVIENCSEALGLILSGAEKLYFTSEAMETESSEESRHCSIFQFGMIKINSRAELREDECVVDFLSIVDATCSFLLKNYKKSLERLKKNSKTKLKDLWYYLTALNAYMLEDYDQSQGFLMKGTSLILDKKLKCRYNILHGQLCSQKDDHKEALRFYGKAKEAMPEILSVYYHIGEEYGKMGLGDKMVENFEEVIKILKHADVNQSQLSNASFTSIILDLIHPRDEITEAEALYVLAVAYGLDENFQKSADAYEKLTQSKAFESFPNPKERLLKTPSVVTVLHEAAIANLLTGDLMRAEQLCNEAFETYEPTTDVENASKKEKSKIHVRDREWLRNLIEQELGLKEALNESETIRNVTIFREENIYFFQEDIIGLLILAEIQKIQENEDYKSTLSKIISVISKHLSRNRQKTDSTEEETQRIALIKALAGKTCLNIARYQMNSKSDSEVDKMMKRALTCNQGDKDVLYQYWEFLMRLNKKTEAAKLWKTFYNKESTVSPDRCQSLALRFLLRTVVSKRELDKIRNDVEFSNANIS